MNAYPALQLIFRWIVVGCRFVVGFLVAKSGVSLLQGDPLLGYDNGDAFTGWFVFLIGAYIIYNAFVPVFFPDKET